MQSLIKLWIYWQTMSWIRIYWTLSILNHRQCHWFPTQQSLGTDQQLSQCMNTAQWPRPMTPLHKLHRCARNKPQRDIIVLDQAKHNLQNTASRLIYQTYTLWTSFSLNKDFGIYIKKKLLGNCWEIPWFRLILHMLRSSMLHGNSTCQLWLHGLHVNHIILVYDLHVSPLLSGMHQIQAHAPWSPVCSFYWYSLGMRVSGNFLAKEQC